MRSSEIQRLVDAVEAIYGPTKLYGSSPDEKHGTCFKINAVPATFSVLTLDGSLPSGRYDIQIEGSPPGDYLYASEVTLDTFLELISRMTGPADEWPRRQEEIS